MNNSQYYKFSTNIRDQQASDRSKRAANRPNMSIQNTNNDTKEFWVEKAKEIEKAKETLAKELEELKLENAKLSDSLGKIEKRLSDAAKANTTEMPEATIKNDDLKSIFDFILEKDKRTLDLVNHQITTQERYFNDKLTNLQSTTTNNDSKIKLVTKPFQLSGKEDDYFI